MIDYNIFVSCYDNIMANVAAYVILIIIINNIYLLQLGCHPVAVVILHVNKT